jgi:hypothetical protein
LSSSPPWRSTASPCARAAAAAVDAEIERRLLAAQVSVQREFCDVLAGRLRAGRRLRRARSARAPRRASDTTTLVDRRLAYKNLRTGLIAGAIAIIVFALSWVVGLVY